MVDANYYMTAFFGGIGTMEVVILFAVILLLFGPKRLPSMAREFGRLTAMFRKAADAFRHELVRLDVETLTGPDDPVKPEKTASNDGPKPDDKPLAG